MDWFELYMPIWSTVEWYYMLNNYDYINANFSCFFFVLLTEFLYFAARLLRDKYTNGFFLKQEKRNELLPVIKKRKKSKI